MASEVKAETLGRAAARDMQIAVPAWPVMRHGVRLRQVGDTVVLDGADRPQVFTGSFARENLARLAATCDGTHTHAELAAAIGLGETAVYKSLTLLWASGVIEEGATATPDPALSTELVCLLSRLGNSTGANASWTDSAARLATHTVHLAGDNALVAATTRALEGVCAVVTGDDPPATSDVLTVFFESAHHSANLVTLAEWCWARGRPLLRVRAETTAMVLGPYVDPAFSPCLGCGTAEDEPHDGTPPQTQELVAGLAAHHITALVSRST